MRIISLFRKKGNFKNRISRWKIKLIRKMKAVVGDEFFLPEP